MFDPTTHRNLFQLQVRVRGFVLGFSTFSTHNHAKNFGSVVIVQFQSV